MTSAAEKIVAEREAAQRAAEVAEVQAQLDAEAKAKREAAEREERVLGLIEDHAPLVVEFAEAGHDLIAAVEAAKVAVARLKAVKGQSRQIALEAKDPRVGVLCSVDLRSLASEFYGLRIRILEVGASPHHMGPAKPHGVSLK